MLGEISKLGSRRQHALWMSFIGLVVLVSNTSRLFYKTDVAIFDALSQDNLGFLQNDNVYQKGSLVTKLRDGVDIVTANRKADTIANRLNSSIVLPSEQSSCAILFFGLPRSFQQYVLPSIIQNIMIPNIKYGCDYYMHYYHISEEEEGRSGYSGIIDPNQVYLINDALTEVDRQYASMLSIDNARNPVDVVLDKPNLSIVFDTNETFWEARGDILHTYRTTRNEDDNNNYKYFPYRANTYRYPTTMDNVIKQWHSIDAVWKEMEKRSTTKINKKYERIAMLRNDVIYLTQIDVYDTSFLNHKLNQTIDNTVIIPNWANHPVNDRMIIGPYKAVKLWATQRLDRVEYHVNTYRPIGYGIHSERMMAHTILPAIEREYNISICPTNQICFVRVRVDGGIWYHDCDMGKSKYTGNVKTILRDMILPALNTTVYNGTLKPHLMSLCEKKKLHFGMSQIHCPPIFDTRQEERNGHAISSLVKRLWKLNEATS